MDIAISRTTPCAPIFEVARDGEAEAEAERLPMTTRRIRGARKGAGWISRVRLEPEPAPAVRWRPIARTRDGLTRDCIDEGAYAEGAFEGPHPRHQAIEGDEAHGRRSPP